ncbi:hypothetical protein SIN8267_02185 [Sinobacterium norvegicum]|uniref:Lipase modulator n=1 Tax=Sinobacterium norvegicum TaxID=1641715 RepID=A0ABN8ELM8_9GAMM|nr:hypothetical protein [Sinobacterium norvegicum]CAH0992070.1 hypothetical protein SIN8267_02185 [Sinobacterium norvegicum]
MKQRELLFAVIGLTLVVVAASLFVASATHQQPLPLSTPASPIAVRPPPSAANHRDTTPPVTYSVAKQQPTPRQASNKPIFYPAQQRYRISPDQVPALIAYARHGADDIEAESEYLLFRLLKQCRQPISDQVLNQQLRHLEQRQQNHPEQQPAVERQKQQLINRYLSCQQLAETGQAIEINNSSIRQHLEAAAAEGLAIAQVELFMQYSSPEQRRHPELLFQARAQCSIDGFIALMQFYSQDDNNPEQDIDSYSHLVMVERLLANYQPQPQVSTMLRLRKQILLDNMYLYEQQQAVRQSEQYAQQYCQ